MVKVYLNSTDMSTSFLLPVTPDEITISTGLGVRKYETANNGNISQIGYEELASVSFSSFFPSNAREYSLNNSVLGMSGVAQIERFITNRLPCRLIIVGMNFDRTMIIEKFEYSMKQGKDVYYTIKFVQQCGV